MTKRELIKEEYKKYFYESAVEHRMYISFNGWSDKLNLDWIRDDEFLKELDIRETTFRPKSLQGIEDNNGWIRIESEEDLPKEEYDVFYNLHDIDNNETVYYKTYDDLEFMWKKGIITHYKQTIEEKPPIY